MKKLLVFIMLFFTGCVSLTAEEEETFAELESYGVDYSAFEPKNAFIAGFNIFGIGNFYLGSGEHGEESQTSLGVTNFWVTLFTLGLSVVWTIPEAIIDTHTINKRAVINYYKFDPEGVEKYYAFQRKYLRK